MTDVAVYGATACGVMAAAAARDAGAEVVLVEPGEQVGGTVSGGLSWRTTCVTVGGARGVIGSDRWTNMRGVRNA